MANRFYTLMVIPEKTAKVRRIVVPAWLVRGFVIGSFFMVALVAIMVLDYYYVIDQIDENKQLKVESRRLRQQVQIYRNKMEGIEKTMDRVQTFSTRLKVITNIEERDSLVQKLNQSTLPDAMANLGVKPESVTNASSFSQLAESSVEEILLKSDERGLEDQLGKLQNNTLLLEQNLQDLYELLIDQKAFLSALPTRRPAVGYPTSGFGVRRSPYGDRDKMHEGLDIANMSGTPIKATANGTIKHAGLKPGYGKLVVVDHGYGMETWYGHTSKVLVQLGQKVKRGESIGLIGNSGRSTGPHVHYEVRVNGIPVDPLPYILEN